jgi:hypothetical protein
LPTRTDLRLLVLCYALDVRDLPVVRVEFGHIIQLSSAAVVRTHQLERLVVVHLAEALQALEADGIVEWRAAGSCRELRDRDAVKIAVGKVEDDIVLVTAGTVDCLNECVLARRSCESAYDEACTCLTTITRELLKLAQRKTCPLRLSESVAKPFDALSSADSLRSLRWSLGVLVGGVLRSCRPLERVFTRSACEDALGRLR